jgi:pyruvate,water dikinase
LGELTRAKIPVPPGFVVLASAFNYFLKKNNLEQKIEELLQKVNTKNINSVNRTSQKIRQLISKGVFPKDIAKEALKDFDSLKAKYVAVRSSATAEDSKIASWAGELETYLNITRKNLLSAIKKCWSSLFTPRAIFYRFEKKLNKKEVAVAVVVQKMVQSQVSGICFTVHPVTQDKDQMVIEAGWGLGEAVVGGKITPDTYIISKKDNTILDINISEQKIMIVRSLKGVKEKKVPKSRQEKQKLSNNQIIKLARICKEIEKHYKFPQDIEWAFEKNKFYIVQSRPITTL